MRWGYMTCNTTVPNMSCWNCTTIPLATAAVCHFQLTPKCWWKEERENSRNPKGIGNNTPTLYNPCKSNGLIQIANKDC